MIERGFPLLGYMPSKCNSWIVNTFAIAKGQECTSRQVESAARERDTLRMPNAGKHLSIFFCNNNNNNNMQCM